MSEYSPPVEDAVAKLCRTMALETVKELALALNDLPMPDDVKMSMLLTIEISMIDSTLDGMHAELSPEDRLRRKLEFFSIVRRNAVRTAQEQKKEKSK